MTDTIITMRSRKKQMHLDPGTVQKLRDVGNRLGEGTFVRTLIERFVEATPARLKDIHTASLKGDCATLEFEAHTLKSSCGHVGAVVMAEVCQTLESLARTGDARGTARLVAQLYESFELVTPTLTELLDECVEEAE